MGTRDKPTAPASPWQNGFAERLIGSIRRECVDHIVVLGEAHLRRVLRLFTKNDYYRDPDMMPDLKALQRNVDTTADMGFIKSRFDVKQHSDLSLIEEAAKRLK